MENRMAPPVPTEPQSIARLEANAAEALWRTDRIQSSPVSIGDHLGTMESGDGRT